MRGPEADRARLDRWCAGVGPAVVHTPADRRGAPSVREVAVVSWNTNVGGGDLHGFIADLRAGRFTGGDSVQHFVLLLQEVFRRGPDVPRGAATRPRRIAPQPARGHRADIVEVARQHDLHLFYVPSMANGWAPADVAAEDRGNAIVSTLPLDGRTAIELPYEGQRRVAAGATVRSFTPDGRALHLRVVSVHLDNRSTLSRVHHSFGSGRARQAEALAAALRRDTEAHLPTVLAGDLNTWAPHAWERALGVLRTHFPQGNATTAPTFAGRPMGVGRTLDHMMFDLADLTLASTMPATDPVATSGPSGSARRVQGTDDRVAFESPISVRLDDARGSDHYPLLARLSFGDRS